MNEQQIYFYIFTRPEHHWIFFGGKKRLWQPVERLLALSSLKKSVSLEEEEEDEEGGSAADDCMLALIYTINASLLPGGNRPKARGSSG